jgi:hypothetical protein
MTETDLSVVQAEVVDGHNRTLLPGLFDAHVQLLLSITSESDDPVISEMVQAYNSQLSTLIYDLLKDAQKQGILPVHLDLTAAYWGFVSFLFGLQQRVKLHLVNQIDEHALREMNRLWLVALRIG